MGGFAINADAQVKQKKKTQTENRVPTQPTFSTTPNGSNTTNSATNQSKDITKKQEIVPKLDQYVNDVNKYVESFETGIKSGVIVVDLDRLEGELDALVNYMSQAQKMRFNDAKGRYSAAKQAHSSNGNKSPKMEKKSQGDNSSSPKKKQ